MPANARRFDPLRPYNDLPRLPPRADVDTRDVLRACIEARAAVAALKQAGHLVPNQSILINTLPVLEARASSEIENIVTTTDRLFQYAQDERQPVDAATKEALRYRTALRRGFDSLANRPLTTATAVNVCRTLRASIWTFGRCLAPRLPISRRARSSTRRHKARRYFAICSRTGSGTCTMQT